MRAYPSPYSYDLAQAQAAMMELQRRGNERQERMVRRNTILAASSVLLAMLAVVLSVWRAKGARGAQHQANLRHEEQLGTLRDLLHAGHAITTPVLHR